VNLVLEIEHIVHVTVLLPQLEQQQHLDIEKDRPLNRRLPSNAQTVARCIGGTAWNTTHKSFWRFLCVQRFAW
jgi:hypothetical protein